MRHVSSKAGRPVFGRRQFLPRDLPGCVLWLRADLGITFGATLTSQGTTPPVVTISGTPTSLFGLHIEIDSTAGGTGLGQATFKWSTNNGTSYVATGVATAASVVLGSTGITAAFPAGPYNTDNKYDATVSQANDMSGLGNNATPASTTRATLTMAGINSRPSFSFPGSANQQLQTGNLSLGAFSVLLVAKLSGTAGYLWTHNANTVNGAYLYGDVSNTTTIVRSSNASAYDKSTNWAVDNVARAIVLTFDGTHAGHKIYFGGVTQTLANVSAVDPGTSAVSGPMFITTTQSGTAPSTGLVGEAAVWTRALTASDVAKLSAYTRSWWGV